MRHRHSALCALVVNVGAQVGNRPERLEWFRDLGFGLFIHELNTENRQEADSRQLIAVV
jgi:hypothetical protein